MLEAKMFNYYPEKNQEKENQILKLYEASANLMLELDNKDYVYDCFKNYIVIRNYSFYQCLDILDELNERFSLGLVRYDYNIDSKNYDILIHDKKAIRLYNIFHNLKYGIYTMAIKNTYYPNLGKLRHFEFCNSRALYALYISKNYNFQFLITSCNNYEFNIELIPIKFKNKLYDCIQEDATFDGYVVSIQTDAEDLYAIRAYDDIFISVDSKEYKPNVLEVKNRKRG